MCINHDYRYLTIISNLSLNLYHLTQQLNSIDIQTPKKKKIAILKIVSTYQKHYKVAPKAIDIAMELRIPYSTAWWYIDKMVEKGELVRYKGRIWIK